jgi:hypothetical protein
MNDEIVERLIFSLVIMPETFLIIKYMRLYFCGLTEKSLLMLCYFTNLKKYCYDDKKSTYINMLVNHYWRLLSKQDKNTLIQMLNVISDEKYEKYTDEIMNNSGTLDLSFENEEDILENVFIHRPPQRKYNIQIVTPTTPKNAKTNTNTNECPICFETYAPKEIIKTSCNHNYCKDCLNSYLTSLNITNTDPCCAYCREKITKLEIKDEKYAEHFKDKYCMMKPIPEKQESNFPRPSLPQQYSPPPPQAPPPQAPPQQQQHLLQRLVFYIFS